MRNPRAAARRKAPSEPLPRSGPAPVPRVVAASGLAAVLLATAPLYWRTAARDIVVGDTPEYVTTAVTLGVAHPPGYPLLTLLGHLFSQVPWGAVPWRVNLVSVVCGTAAVLLVYATALRLTRHVAASAVAALVLAWSGLFWDWSLVAEVFALNNALAAALLYLLVVWRERPERPAPLVAGAFVAGLGVCNQLTLVLLGPAVLWLVWTRRSALRPAVVASCVAAFALALLPYAYIPWAASRHPFLNWGAVSSAGDLLDLFLRRSYGTGHLVAPGPHAGGSPVDRVEALLAAPGWLMGPLLLAGVVGAWRAARWYLAFALLAFAFAGPFFVVIANLDIAQEQSQWVLARFFLLSQVAVAPLMAFGLLALGEGLGRAWPAVRGRAAAVVCAAAAAAAAVGAWRDFPARDQRDNHIARHFAEDVLATLEPGTVLLAGGDHALLPLAYLQAVEGRRPDVTLVMLPLLGAEWYVEELRRRHPDLVIGFARHTTGAPTMRRLVADNPGRPVALLGDVLEPSLKGDYWLYRYGLVYRVLPLDRDVMLSAMTRENEALLARYRPPAAAAVDERTFEVGILVNYAAPALAIARENETGGRHAQAAEWYRRALAIAPELEPAREGLARATAATTAEP